MRQQGKNIAMRCNFWVMLLLLALIPFTAQAQLAGSDSEVGDSCAGFEVGSTRMNANASGDGTNVLLICNGTTWQSAGGGGGGGAPIIDQIAGTGVTIEAVSIAATGDKWPDYIVCGAGAGTSIITLSWYSPLSGDDEAFYMQGSSWYEFSTDGNYKGRASLDANCGASANDINTICNDNRCGFFGGGGGGGGGSGTFQFSDDSTVCDTNNVGLVVYDASDILKVCDGDSWNILFSKFLTCSLWEENRRVSCGGSMSSMSQTHASRASCQSWCESSSAAACDYEISSNTCRAYLSCGNYGTVSDSDHNATACFN